jgi:ectoine hydroxylase-related dioxygenase (phytanoyl-CoA dioxygenase family)
MSTQTITALGATQVSQYRRDGFTVVRGALSREEAARFAEAATAASARIGDHAAGDAVFNQALDAWRHDETMRELTLHARLGSLAEQLAGAPLRLWHDQILIKEPGRSTATEFHQDQPYWPHAGSPNPITAWVALVDVPVERGCMTFIPGSQRLTDLSAQDLHSETSLFEMAPELAWEERVTCPLRAGDVTFHHGRCAHAANPNRTDVARVAHAIIYVDAATTYTGAPHPITDPLSLDRGERLPDDRFPLVGRG